MNAIQPIAQHLTVVIRQPTWIFGPFGEKQREYSPEEIKTFTTEPNVLTAKRKKFESKVNSYFGFCLKGSPQQVQVRSHLIEEIRKKLKAASPEKLDESAFIPSYAVGCRRPTPGVGYIEALTSSNVSLAVGPVREVTKSGIIASNGTETEIDVLICATGFDTSHRPPFALRGIDGMDLRETWKERAIAYLAVAVPQIPNYFVFYGPNNPFGSGAFLITIGKTLVTVIGL